MLRWGQLQGFGELFLLHGPLLFFFFFFKNIMCAGATHSEEKGRVGWGWIVGGGEWEEGHEQDVK